MFGELQWPAGCSSAQGDQGDIFMAGTQRRYPKEEFARRGDAMYESAVKPHLKPADEGRFVAVDIETGEYEIADDLLEASDKLHARLPQAQPWVVRVGSRYVLRIGGSSLRGTP